MKPHFSLRRIFIAITLVAVGLALLMRVIQIPNRYHWLADFPVCFVAGALIGGGALVVFKRTLVGALIGVTGAGIYLTAIALGL